MKKWLKLIPAGLFFALLLIYAGGLLSRTVWMLTMKSEPGWSPRQYGNRVLVAQINVPDEAYPLHTSDEIVAINGLPVSSSYDCRSILHDIQNGERYTITIRRPGYQLSQEVVLRTQPIPLASWILRAAASLLIPTIFLATGIAVFLVKPDDKQALLLSLMFGMFIGAIYGASPGFEGFPYWIVPAMVLVQIASSFLWPVFFHFFLIFPEPSQLLNRFRRLELYLYAPHILIILPFAVALNLVAAFWPGRLLILERQLGLVWVLALGLGATYIAAGLFTLILKYRKASRTSRRKMRVVVAGSVAGFVPMFLLIGSALLLDLPRNSPTLFRWLGFTASFSFILFPLSFAYAIVRHQVIPVKLIVRRSVRYLLVSRGFIIVQAIVVFFTLSFLLTGRRMALIDGFGERADVIVTMFATAVAIGLLTIVNQRVMPIIDRRFFREAYDAQQVLAELAQSMRSMTSVAQLLELALEKIQAALHTENVTIFLGDQKSGDYVAAVSSCATDESVFTSNADATLTLPRNGSVVKRLRQSPMPIAVDLDRPRSWARTLLLAEFSTDDSPARERTTLRHIGAELLLPIATKDELIGVISFGPRLGDLPYSREDKQLLMAVAMQMALAIQNTQLIQQTTEEERLRRELEIATAVQQRLFPQQPPELPRLDLAGICLPARGVGGDYYDFIELESGAVGIAVADVAGKGISAALLMSTIQASLRSQAGSVNGKLTELVSSMNRLLHSSTDSNDYATFFYAEIDTRSGLLTYVNAGHNPPILLRAASQVKAGHLVAAAIETGGSAIQEVQIASGETAMLLLSVGGPVIGAFCDCQYSQEVIQTRPGDLLVAYTDGVTEAANHEGEEFGEWRLKKIVSQSASLSARELTDRIVNQVREFCGETPQYDDLTLVVMRVEQ